MKELFCFANKMLLLGVVLLCSSFQMQVQKPKPKMTSYKANPNQPVNLEVKLTDTLNTIVDWYENDSLVKKQSYSLEVKKDSVGVYTYYAHAIDTIKKDTSSRVEIHLNVELGNDAVIGSDIVENDGKLNFGEYSFYIFLIVILILSVVVIFSLSKIKNMKENEKKRFNETRVSVIKSIDEFKKTIAHYNSLLKGLGVEQEIIAKVNAEKQSTNIENTTTLEDIFIQLNVELNEISRQVLQLEKVHKENSARLKKFEDGLELPAEQLRDLQKNTMQQLSVKEQEIISLKEKLEKNTLTVPSFVIPNDVYINSSVLLSAGPRKDIDKDTELGEDACGVYNTPAGTFFWVMDGTSDSPGIIHKSEHIFSSRILAQLMSNYVLNIIIQKSNSEIDLKEVLIEAVQRCKTAFLEKLDSISPEIRKNIFDALESNKSIYCSSTVQIGFFSKLGDLKYFYLGDSDVYAYSLESGQLKSLPKDSNENPSRLFFSLKIEDSKLDIITNPFAEKLVLNSKDQVDLVIAFSDGIGASEKALMASPHLALSKIGLVNQLTYDDKVLIVLEKNKI